MRERTKPVNIEWLKPDWKEILERESAEGASPKELYVKVGAKWTWIKLLCKQYEEFDEAWGEALSRSEAWWLEQGRKNIGKSFQKFNAALWYMNMKNLHGWKDKHDVTSDNEKVGGVILLPPKRKSNPVKIA